MVKSLPSTVSLMQHEQTAMQYAENSPLTIIFELFRRVTARQQCKATMTRGDSAAATQRRGKVGCSCFWLTSVNHRVYRGRSSRGKQNIKEKGVILRAVPSLSLMFKYLNKSVAISASGLSVHASSLSLFEKKNGGIACHFRQYSSWIISKISFLTTFVSPNITVVQSILAVSLYDTRRFIVMYNICLAHTQQEAYTLQKAAWQHAEMIVFSTVQSCRLTL